MSHGVLNPLGSPDNPTFCLCAAPQSSPSAADQAQSNNYPQLALCLAPPVHQTKPIGHGPSSGLALCIFSSPARLRSPSLPAYTCCRRAAKLKMLCRVSLIESAPSWGSSLVVACGFSRHLGSRASLSWFVRRCVLRAPSLTADSRPSRITRKRHRPRVSKRTMVAT